MKRRISKPHKFEDQLAEAALKLKAQARTLGPGEQRDELLRKIRQIDAAAHLNEWLKSPGLRSPK
ncbi:hypothetical protein [Bradyrhizobium sp. sBnM-33]|uniref:hypothetical protein n=1 Tax=Bradyrhizobium sp. sBnM-33 TaxID=2831780 RepID=UPI001BCD6CD2|nr:hypothetical protein [Bradyrhizobium sp. sBnM-33]WOH53512.1 hypothetical protein RX328_16325 [Bradyrhizobium sp. sBnM-33]